jgi:glycosyltransferase involved in cell wall biosynthesis
MTLAERIDEPMAVAEAGTIGARRPARVLHVIDGLGVGGAETWLMALLRFWSANGGVAADILATGGLPRVFDGEAATLGAHIHYLRFGRDNLGPFASGLRAVLRDGRYDVMHDHQDHASGWHYLIGGRWRPPVRVTHVHNLPGQIRENYGVTARRRLTSKVGRRLVARYATHIVGTSDEAVTAFRFGDPAFAGIPNGALYCGLEPERFLAGAEPRDSVRAEFGWAFDAPIALFAGRFDVGADIDHPLNHKNSGFAVDVAIACALQNQQVRFLFAGAASAATPLLRQRIEAAGLGQRIVFAGVRRDIGRLMAAGDTLLFPSRAEGLGMAAVEAQAAGMPVLASTGTPRECVVIPELVRFLPVDAGVEYWRDQLLALIDAPRLDPLAANARVAASPFAIAHSARRLETLYRTGSFGP